MTDRVAWVRSKYETVAMGPLQALISDADGTVIAELGGHYAIASRRGKRGFKIVLPQGNFDVSRCDEEMERLDDGRLLIRSSVMSLPIGGDFAERMLAMSTGLEHDRPLHDIAWKSFEFSDSSDESGGQYDFDFVLDGRLTFAPCETVGDFLAVLETALQTTRERASRQQARRGALARAIASRGPAGAHAITLGDPPR